jgi:hypothetical protein
VVWLQASTCVMCLLAKRAIVTAPVILYTFTQRSKSPAPASMWFKTACKGQSLLAVVMWAHMGGPSGLGVIAYTTVACLVAKEPNNSLTSVTYKVCLALHC